MLHKIEIQMPWKYKHNKLIKGLKRCKDHTPVQDAPRQRCERRKPTFSVHPDPLFDLLDLQLHLNSERMEEVSAEHEGVSGSVDRVDPPGRDHERVPLLQSHQVALFHEIGEEDAPLLPSASPLLEKLKVFVGGFNQPEQLFSYEIFF